MENNFLTSLLLYTCIPVVTFVGGGIIATYKKTPAAFRSIILHFAAGVIFSVVAVELLPDIIERNQPLYVAIGFITGTVLMLLVKDFSENEETKTKTVGILPVSLVVAIGVDVLIDGFLLGIGFGAGAETGLLITLALALEMFSMGLALAAQLKEEGIAQKKSVGLITALSSLFFVGAVLGGVILSHVNNEMMEVVLSFGLSALLFLVTEELLVEAHNEEDKPLHTATFFVGFLLFLVLGMIM